MAHRRLNATALARTVILLGTLVLAGCNAPHSEETQKDDDATTDVASVAPVKTVTLAASNEPEKLEGIATVLNPDVLLQLDADIRSATVAANFSHGQLERFKASTMLSRQTLENAVRQDGIDASQLKLLLTRLQQSWGDKAPVRECRCPADIDGRHRQRLARSAPPRLRGYGDRHARECPCRSPERRAGNEGRCPLAGAFRKSRDARRLVLRPDQCRALGFAPAIVRVSSPTVRND